MKNERFLYRVEFSCNKGVGMEDVLWLKEKVSNHDHILAMKNALEKRGVLSVVLLNWTLLTDNATTHGARPGVAHQTEKAFLGTPCPSIFQSKIFPFTQVEE